MLCFVYNFKIDQYQYQPVLKNVQMINGNILSIPYHDQEDRINYQRL